MGIFNTRPIGIGAYSILPEDLLESLADNGFEALPDAFRLLLNAAMLLERQKHCSWNAKSIAPGTPIAMREKDDPNLLVQLAPVLLLLHWRGFQGLHKEAGGIGMDPHENE